MLYPRRHPGTVKELYITRPPCARRDARLPKLLYVDDHSGFPHRTFLRQTVEMSRNAFDVVAQRWRLMIHGSTDQRRRQSPAIASVSQRERRFAEHHASRVLPRRDFRKPLNEEFV